MWAFSLTNGHQWGNYDVMTGKLEQEQGQVGIVTRQTPCMVEVAVPAAVGVHTVTHLKKPSSLILLESGLVLVQEKDGSVWIRNVPLS